MLLLTPLVADRRMLTCQQFKCNFKSSPTSLSLAVSHSAGIRSSSGVQLGRDSFERFATAACAAATSLLSTVHPHPIAFLGPTSTGRKCL